MWKENTSKKYVVDEENHEQVWFPHQPMPHFVVENANEKVEATTRSRLQLQPALLPMRFCGVSPAVPSAVESPNLSKGEKGYAHFRDHSWRMPRCIDNFIASLLKEQPAAERCMSISLDGEDGYTYSEGKTNFHMPMVIQRIYVRGICTTFCFAT